MEKWKEFFARHGPGLVLVAGAASVTLGAGLIYLPAGFIAGGVLAIVWWALDSLGGGGEGL